MYTSEDLYLNHSLNRAHIVSCLLLLVSVVSQPVMSDHGLLTTVAYKLGRDKPACYALEVQRPEYTHVPLFLSFLIVQFTATFFFSCRVLWPSQELWSAGCRTTSGSSDRQKSSVRFEDESDVASPPLWCHSTCRLSVKRY